MPTSIHPGPGQRNDLELPHRDVSDNESIPEDEEEKDQPSYPEDNFLRAESRRKESLPPDEVIHSLHGATYTGKPAPERHFFGLNQEPFQPVPLGAGQIYQDDYEQRFRPDKQFEEMSANSRLYRVYQEEAATADGILVGQSREGLDLMLVFAGLFSAVVTSFLVQITNDLQQDYAEMSASLLYELVDLQRAIARGESTDSVESSPLNPSSAFKVDSLSTVINVLWASSLSISLSVALVAVLVKQWLQHYVSLPSGTPRDRAHLRQYRYMGLKQWKVSLIIGLLPTLMSASLGLFFIGLALFYSSLSTTTAWPVAAIAITVGALYFVGNALPVFVPQCPYHTPLTSFIYIIWRTTTYVGPILSRLQSYFPVAMRAMIRGFNLPKFPPARSYGILPPTLRKLEILVVQRWQDTLSVESLHWLFNFSTNPSVRSIVIQGAGGLRHTALDDMGRIFGSNDLADVQTACSEYLGIINNTPQELSLASVETLERTLRGMLVLRVQNENRTLVKLPSSFPRSTHISLSTSQFLFDTINIPFLKLNTGGHPGPREITRMHMDFVNHNWGAVLHATQWHQYLKKLVLLAQVTRFPARKSSHFATLVDFLRIVVLTAMYSRNEASQATITTAPGVLVQSDIWEHVVTMLNHEPLPQSNWVGIYSLDQIDAPSVHRLALMIIQFGMRCIKREHQRHPCVTQLELQAIGLLTDVLRECICPWLNAPAKDEILQRDLTGLRQALVIPLPSLLELAQTDRAISSDSSNSRAAGEINKLRAHILFTCMSLAVARSPESLNIPSLRRTRYDAGRALPEIFNLSMFESILGNILFQLSNGAQSNRRTWESMTRALCVGISSGNTQAFDLFARYDWIDQLLRIAWLEHSWVDTYGVVAQYLHGLKEIASVARGHPFKCHIYYDNRLLAAFLLLYSHSHNSPSTSGQKWTPDIAMTPVLQELVEIDPHNESWTYCRRVLRELYAGVRVTNDKYQVSRLFQRSQICDYSELLIQALRAWPLDDLQKALASLELCLNAAQEHYDGPAVQSSSTLGDINLGVFVHSPQVVFMRTHHVRHTNTILGIDISKDGHHFTASEQPNVICNISSGQLSSPPSAQRVIWSSTPTAFILDEKYVAVLVDSDWICPPSYLNLHDELAKRVWVPGMQQYRIYDATNRIQEVKKLVYAKQANIAVILTKNLDDKESIYVIDLDAEIPECRLLYCTEAEISPTLCLSPNLDLLLGIIEDDNTIVILDLATGELPLRWSQDNQDIQQLAFTPSPPDRDHTTLVSASRDREGRSGTISWWSLDLLARSVDLAGSLTDHNECIEAVAISRDARLVASASDQTLLVKIWNADTHELLVTIAGRGDKFIPGSITFSPYSEHFIAQGGHRGNIVRVFLYEEISQAATDASDEGATSIEIIVEDASNASGDESSE